MEEENRSQPAFLGEETNFKRHLKFLTFLFNLIGMWPKSGKFKWNFYLILTVISVILVGAFSASHVAKLYMTSKTDIMKATTNTYLSYEFIICTRVKMYYGIKHFSKIKDLLNKIDKGYFVTKSTEELAILNTPINAWGKLSKSYVIFVFFANFLAWWCAGLQDGHEFLVDYWVPCDTEKNKCFYVALPFQFFISLIDSTLIFLYLLTVGFMVYATAQIDLLIHRIKSMVAVCKEKAKLAHDNLGVGSYEDVMEKELKKRFGECLQHHKTIVRFVKDINVITREMNFVIYACVLFTFCICLLSSVVSDDPLYSVFYLFVTGVFSIELVILCWFGSELMAKSSSLSNAAYESHWEDCSTSHRKNILFFIHCTQKPLNVAAIDIIPLSLEMGMKIFKTSWSYFLVLQHVFGGD